MVGADNPSKDTPGTLEPRLRQLKMKKGPLDPTMFMEKTSLEAPGRSKVKALIEAKFLQNPPIWREW